MVSEANEPGSESGKRSDDRRGAARGTRAGSWTPQEGGASSHLAARLSPRSPGSFAAAAMVTPTASCMETRRLTLAERLYLPQVVEGVAVTTRHFVRNLALHTLHLFGLARDKSAAVTTQYPEQRKPYSEGYRGAHRLTLKPDGSVRCTACFLCATACPARCINIEAGEHPDPEVEKYPLRYVLGLARDPLTLSRRYPMWRILSPLRLLVSPRYAAAVARWLEYRMNLFDGVEG